MLYLTLCVVMGVDYQVRLGARGGVGESGRRGVLVRLGARGCVGESGKRGVCW